MIKINAKVWGKPLLIWWCFVIFVGVVSVITPSCGEDASHFDKLKDLCISTSMGISFIVMLWIILSRYKKFNIPVRKRTTILVSLLTVVYIVSAVGSIIVYLCHRAV
jgi:hypothetical protein